MKPCQFKFILIMFLIILSGIVSGQKIRFYNSEQGLPNSLIHTVSQDKEGYIWIAMRFTTFHHDANNQGSLSSDLIKVIFTDSRGVCWVGTANGVQIFDRDNNTFRQFSLQCPLFKGTPYVSSIAENKNHDKLLVSVAGFGILVYDEQTQQIDLETTNKLKNLYGADYIGTLFIDSDGFLWSYSEQGFFFKVDPRRCLPL